ncbi:nicotinamide-nucleotide amidohydrolase family protein [Nicoliella lavandulae]|uniref:nicotinamide-nucleotide amidohydrolase family protein n=1 Tax=Nicoliella lavandulae TaxID=3082954 RepID=UPI0035A02CC5
MANDFQTNVVQRLIERNLTITAAESLTAGMFQSTLGDVAGVSAIFPGGFVTYANDVKHQLVNVKTQTIEQAGVVSEATAIEMANGARNQLATDIGVSFTGVAGPDALEDNPAGTVWIGISFGKQAPFANVYHFSGDRASIRHQSVAAAFELIDAQLN